MESLSTIWAENEYIDALCGDGARLKEAGSGDIEIWPRRLFVNPAADLLKFVYFFAAVKEQMALMENHDLCVKPIHYEIYILPMDQAILRMYPEIILSEEVTVYGYQSEEDTECY